MRKIIQKTAHLNNSSYSSIIDTLIKKTAPRKKIIESPSDVQEINCRHNNQPGCLKCLKCGGESGTLRIITHHHKCKYKEEVTTGPFEYGNYIPGIVLNRDLSIGILQREYALINKETEKKIIGTYGAGPCIILCMRDRETTNTMLGHIDSLTIDPVAKFREIFQPNNSDVYLIGGNNSSTSKKHLHNLLKELKIYNYDIKFAYLMDNKSNSFAINCITQEVFINHQINPKQDLPLVYDLLEREKRMMQIFRSKSELFRVN